MAYSRQVQGYPQQMKEVVQKVADQLVVMEIECGTPKAARGLRARFYQMFGAAKRDVTINSPYTTKEDAILFAQQCFAVEMGISGSTLILRPRDTSPVATLVGAARPRETQPIGEEAKPTGCAHLWHAGRCIKCGLQEAA